MFISALLNCVLQIFKSLVGASIVFRYIISRAFNEDKKYTFVNINPDPTRIKKYRIFSV